MSKRIKSLISSHYCFVPGNTFPTLEGGILDGGTFIEGNGPRTYLDSFVPAGNYSSVNPLEDLVGSTLNGSWTIRVIDHQSQDNGNIFLWGLNFDSAIQPPEISFTPAVTLEYWDADSTIIYISENSITVQPISDGNFCYTYRVMDDFGCEYTKEVCVEVLPELIYADPIDLFVCDTTGAAS